ncbi:MAG: Gfo/Idh/MocA family protein [Burkholderiales bacterium]
MNEPVKVGIVGLGRWARTLTRAVQQSENLRIVSAFGISPEERSAYKEELADEFGIRVMPDMASMLADPDVKGAILTVPNEEHWPCAEAVAQAGKHVYTEKPIATTLEDGLRIAALQERYGVTVTVGHSARLMAGIRQIKAAIDAGELGRVTFIEANFSNFRGLSFTPKMWRWYKDKAPGGVLSLLGIHQFDVLYYLGGEMAEVTSMSSKLSPTGMETDDQSMTLVRFADGKLGYVGACWTSPGVFKVRVFGHKGLMQYEIDFDTWDTPEHLHETATLYIQRGKAGYGNREDLTVEPSDMFRQELDMFAETVRTGKASELSAENGLVSLSAVYGALRAIDEQGRYVRIAEVVKDARKRL